MLWSMDRTFLISLLKIIFEHNSIRQIAVGQGDDNTTYCLLDYNYFKNYYKMIARNLSKQKALDTDPKSNNLTTEAAN